MKRPILLLSLLFLSGCSLINNQPTMPEAVTVPQQETDWIVSNLENIEQVTENETTNPVLPTTSSTFDLSKKVVEWAEISFWWYSRYKDAINFKNWSIWVQMWWQDGFDVELIYTENWKVLKKSSPIFWYDIWYTSKNIYEYCEDRPRHQGYYMCPLITTLECVIDKEKGYYTDCINKALEYMFNLIQWSETNEHFSQEFLKFKNSL